MAASGATAPVLEVAYEAAQGDAAIVDFSRRSKRAMKPKEFASLDAAFASAAKGEVDLVMAPYEKSRGGTAHEVSDMQVKHGLAIVGEYETIDRTGTEGKSSNLTRFLLLRKTAAAIPEGVARKTSICFSLANTAGALSQVLALFAQHGINLVKIESRVRTLASADKLDQHPSAQDGGAMRRVRTEEGGSPMMRRVRSEAVEYLFYVDFLGSPEDTGAAAALEELQKSTAVFRVLGTYPRRGVLVGLDGTSSAEAPEPSGLAARRRLRIGIVGFGNFGQFLGKKMAADLDVFATSREDNSQQAAEMGATWCPTLEELLSHPLDVLMLSVSIMAFGTILEKVVPLLAQSPHPLPLVVDVCSVKLHPRDLMLDLLPPSADVLCTHPMFGPGSSKAGWGGLPIVVDRVRITDAERCEEFLGWWSAQGCRLLQMTCELHDECAAESQFMTHFTGRVLSRLNLKSTMMNTKNYEALMNVVNIICRNSTDLFMGLYKYNPYAEEQLTAFEEAVAEVAQELRENAAQGTRAGGAPAAPVDAAACTAKQEPTDAALKSEVGAK